jgi:Holliday junction DNA helicase RuvB
MTILTKLIQAGVKILDKRTTANKKDAIFDEIVGYSDIKKEFVKALDASSPVGILLCGPPGCGKSAFLKQIRNHFEEESVFIDGSYGSKAGIFQILYDKRPKYVLLDEIDKLSSPDQLALLNLMENGKLTKTTKLESYEIDLEAWVFATANNEEKILEPLLDRFEVYYLTDYTDESV